MVPETGAKTGCPAVSPSTLAQSSEYLYWANPLRFVWVPVLYPWTTFQSPPAIGQAIPVLSPLAASGVGPEAVGGRAAVGTGAGTSMDRGSPSSSPAIAAPSVSSSATTQPEAPLPVTGKKPFSAGPSIERDVPGGSTVRMAESTLGPDRRFASVVVAPVVPGDGAAGTGAATGTTDSGGSAAITGAGSGTNSGPTTGSAAVGPAATNPAGT